MTESITIDPPAGVAGDRRKRARMRLEFPVVLIPAEVGDEISGTTINVSGDGFYCLVPSSAAKVGESLSGILALGVAGARQIRLFCDLRVVRVEPKQEGFGLACRIERYSVRAD
jgi:PilZ domain